jgi:hypothetical protein
VIGNEDGTNEVVNQISLNDQSKFVGILPTDSLGNDLQANKEYQFDAGILVVSTNATGGYHTMSWLAMYLFAENLTISGRWQSIFLRSLLHSSNTKRPKHNYYLFKVYVLGCVLFQLSCYAHFFYF